MSEGVLFITSLHFYLHLGMSKLEQIEITYLLLHPIQLIKKCVAMQPVNDGFNAG